MRWFKHLTTANEDNALLAISEEMGAQGYGVYWLILEHVAKTMPRDCTDVPWVTHSEPVWRDICALKSIRTFRKFVERATQLGLILSKTQAKLRQNSSRTEAERISITIPKLLKYRDEYSRKSGHAPDKLPAVDTETEKRIKTVSSETSRTTEQPPVEKPPETQAGPAQNGRHRPVLTEKVFHELAEKKSINPQTQIPKPTPKTEKIAMLRAIAANPELPPSERELATSLIANEMNNIEPKIQSQSKPQESPKS